MELAGVDSIPTISGGKKSSNSAPAGKILGIEDHLDDLLNTVSPSFERSSKSKGSETVSGTVQSTRCGSSSAGATSSFTAGSTTQTQYKVALRRNATQSSTPSRPPSSRKLEGAPSPSAVHVQGAHVSKNCPQKAAAAETPTQSVQHCPGVHLAEWKRPASSRGRTVPQSSVSRHGMTDDDDDDDDLVTLLPDNKRESATRAHSSSVAPSEKGPSSLTPLFHTKQDGAAENIEKYRPASDVEHDRNEDKPEIRRVSQIPHCPASTADSNRKDLDATGNNDGTSKHRHRFGRKGASTRQTSLDSGFSANGSDLEELLNLSSSSHAGKSVRLRSGGFAACATNDAGNFPSSPPPTDRLSISACSRQGSRKRGNTGLAADCEPPSARPPSSATSSTFFPRAFSHGDGAARSSKSTFETCSVGGNFDVCGTTCQPDTFEANSAAAAADGARAAAAAAVAETVSTDSVATKDTQLELLRAENHALHVDNQMLHRRLQTEIQTAEATNQRKLLGERVEWQSERDKYEIRQRMLEKELDRLRDHQAQESTKFEAAMKALQEQRIMLETEQEKKYSRLLKEAVEKEQQNYKAVLHEKTTHYLQEIREAKRRYEQQLEEQRKFFDERVETHKQQATTQEELYTLMRNVESSAASIKGLTERLATQTAQGDSTLSTKMAEREAALKEVEQRLRDQQQQAAKQHSTLVTLATNFRNQQKAIEDKLFKERERIDAERAEVVKLQRALQSAEEEQRKALESLQNTFQREKIYYLRKQKERDIELDEREQRVKLVEERLRSEKQSLEQQTRSLEEIRARATARLRDIEDEVGEERRRALKDVDAAKSEHLQLLQTRQEIELKQSQLQSQKRIVQEEQRKVEELLDRLHQEGAEVRRLHAEATEARASMDSRGRNLDQKEAKCAEQLQQLQLVLKLVQKERLELLRQESRLLGAGAEVGSCFESDYSFSGLAPAQLQLFKRVEAPTPTSALPGVTPLLAAAVTYPPYSTKKREVAFVTVSPQLRHASGLNSMAAFSDSSADGRGLNVRLRSALSPVQNTKRVPLAAFSAALRSPVTAWQVKHPPVRRVEGTSSTTLAAQLFERCSCPREAYYSSTRQCAAVRVAFPTLSPTEGEHPDKHSSHVTSKAEDQMDLQAEEDGRQCIRLSDPVACVEEPSHAPLYPSCGHDLSAYATRARSGSVACPGGEIYSITACVDGSYRRSISAFPAGARNRSRRAKHPQVAVDRSPSCPRTGSVSLSSLVPPASAFFGQSKPPQKGCNSLSGRDGSCPSAGVVDEVSGQCQDSSPTYCAQYASRDWSATSGRWHAEPATDAASVNKCERYQEAPATGSEISVNQKLQLEDPSNSSSNSGPVADGETQAPPEFVASSASSIVSLKSLPSALST